MTIVYPGPERVGLALVRAEQMRHVPTIDSESVGDHPPVAPPPERLRAHERGAFLASDLGEARVVAGKVLGPHVIRVPAERRDAQGAVRGGLARLAPSAEACEMDVFQSRVVQRRRERAGAEVRVASRAGERAHVGEHRDLRITQDREELDERPRAVTDRPDLHREQCGRLGR